MIVAANIVHDALLGMVGCNRSAALNFASLLFGSRKPFLVLRMVFIDGGRINVLIIVGLDSEQALVFGELVPVTRARRLFQRSVEIGGETTLGNPGLQLAFITKAWIGNGRIRSERVAVT